jgi:hypothetical protein
MPGDIKIARETLCVTDISESIIFKANSNSKKNA